jgi:serine/threonine-protein kinase
VRALNDLDQAIRLKPDEAQLYADRAAELYTQKAFDLAIADCNLVLQMDPGRANLYGLRGRCHAGRGDSEAALRDYAQAIANDPDEAPRYLLWRAELNLECENFAAADADCSQAIDRDPSLAEAYRIRGTVRQQQGESELAIEDFSEAIRLDPKLGLAYLGRAVCRFLRKEFREVVADCNAAAELFPGIVRCYELRGTALKHLGDFDRALADFDEAVRLAPNSTMAFNSRAGLHYARHDYAAAIRDHMEALKRDPRHAGTFNQLGWLWATCPDPDLRNGERAKECASRACELSEWSEAGFLDTLAAACAERGEFEEAIKWQEKALGMAPDSLWEEEYETRLEFYRQRKPIRIEGGIE